MTAPMSAAGRPAARTTRSLALGMVTVALLLLAGCDGVSGLMDAVHENWRIADEGTFEPPPTPENFTAILTADGVLLGWDASERASYYEIQVRELATFVSLAQPEETQYLHADVQPDRVYDYRVRAMLDGTNTSEWSEIVSVSTMGWSGD